MKSVYCDSGAPRELDILIPTYGRAARVEATLKRLCAGVVEEGLHSFVSIRVSDNCSADDTWERIASVVAEHPLVRIEASRQNHNVGLEQNVVSLLESSNASWVMFASDDDELPIAYVRDVLDFARDDQSACALPGVTVVWPDGSSRLVRGEAEASGCQLFVPSLRSVAFLSRLAHQMTGVAFRRGNTAEEYLASAASPNLYPFISFIAYAAQKGKGAYFPNHQVRVLKGQDTDWSYDQSHLLRDALANYRILTGRSAIARSYCELTFVWHQRWRLGLRRSGRLAAFLEVCKSPQVSLISRIALPLLYPAALVYAVWRRLRTHRAV